MSFFPAMSAHGQCELPVAQRAMHHVPVAASPDSEKTAPVEGAAPPFDLAAAEEAGCDVLDRGRRRFLHTQVDPLTLAMTFPLTWPPTLPLIFARAVAGQQRAHGGDRAVV